MQELQSTIDSEALTSRIAALIDAERIGVARPLLAAAQRRLPPTVPGILWRSLPAGCRKPCA